jgi:hypothetical protein
VSSWLDKFIVNPFPKTWPIGQWYGRTAKSVSGWLAPWIHQFVIYKGASAGGAFSNFRMILSLAIGSSQI